MASYQTAPGRPITFVNPPGFVLRECKSDERRADLMRTRVGAWQPQESALWVINLPPELGKRYTSASLETN
ncbi:hypothetical protein J6590_089000 [Homalodisca vitripennis]|nr:hypothetical protein J6590_089000 [Homalodisca vitripennis]